MITALLFATTVTLLVIVGLLLIKMNQMDKEHLEYQEMAIEKVYEARRSQYKAEREVKAFERQIKQYTETIDDANTRAAKLVEDYEALETGYDEMQEGLEQELLSAHDRIEKVTKALLVTTRQNIDLLEIAMYHEDHCLPVLAHMRA